MKYVFKMRVFLSIIKGIANCMYTIAGVKHIETTVLYYWAIFEIIIKYKYFNTVCEGSLTLVVYVTKRTKSILTVQMIYCKILLSLLLKSDGILKLMNRTKSFYFYFLILPPMHDLA